MTYIKLFYYGLNIVFHNLYIVASAWPKGKDVADADAYSEPSGRHGAKLYFFMKLSQSMLAHAVEMENAEEEGERDNGWMPMRTRNAPPSSQNSNTPRGRKRPIGDDAEPSTPPIGRPAKVTTPAGKCKLSALPPTNTNRYCQVFSYLLAPKKPKDHSHTSKDWKRYYSVRKDIKMDKKCMKMMCDKCYNSRWDHDAHCISKGARQHHRTTDTGPVSKT